MSNHATVSRDGYTVPLIGIPASATEYECDLCHEIFTDPTKLTMSESGGQMVCNRCIKDAATA